MISLNKDVRSSNFSSVSLTIAESVLPSSSDGSRKVSVSSGTSLSSMYGSSFVSIVSFFSFPTCFASLLFLELFD